MPDAPWTASTSTGATGEVEYGIPKETEIAEVVRGLRGGEGQGPVRNADGGPKGMDLGGNRKEKLVMHIWEKMVRIIQLAFVESKITE